MITKEIIDMLSAEVRLAEYVDSLACGLVSVQLIKDTIDKLNELTITVNKLKKDKERIINIIKDVEAESQGLFGNHFIRDILLQVYEIDREE